LRSREIKKIKKPTPAAYGRVQGKKKGKSRAKREGHLAGKFSLWRREKSGLKQKGRGEQREETKKRGGETEETRKRLRPAGLQRLKIPQHSSESREERVTVGKENFEGKK